MSLEDEMRRKIAQAQKKVTQKSVSPTPEKTPVTEKKTETVPVPTTEPEQSPKPSEPVSEKPATPVSDKPKVPASVAKPVEPVSKKVTVPNPKKRVSSTKKTAQKRLSISGDAVEACRSYLIQMDQEADAIQNEYGFASTLTNSDVVMFAVDMLLRTENIDGMSPAVAARVRYCLDNGDSVADLKESWARRFDAIDKRLHEMNIGVQVCVQANILTVMDRYGFAPKNVASAAHPGSINFTPTGWDKAFSACRTAARNRMNQEHRPQ